ncbi:MAG TPA: hypothetical protein PK440_10840 [Candidatus Accumulibacter phosphatis]|nr:MAG: serine/threonine protein kinase [Candidatus Accumulibacter sp. SK-11]HCN67086.1 hypothetical protein [Accumulibacter sp.]HCV13895.1 hypothetical protein [Accumulibacter sp.]HRL77132.1 hypothetical protein [Candidatus Accumulibacter phosphatis]HRQ95473.1 hypothetical protein [Candidatus Accumulibacter phosphatis]
MTSPTPATAPAFARADLIRAERTLLRDGRWANARVERVSLEGEEWTLKDFSSRSWWVRNTVGRLLLRRELRALQRLQGIAGTPGDAFRVDAHAIAARFVPGRSLAKIDRTLITPGYLERLEGLLEAVHARGVVHLDTRGAGNVLMLPDGNPGIIDFQASLSTTWMPSGLRRLLEDMDMSGVYKKWAAWQPQAMDGERRARFERSNRFRRLWVPRGYFGLSKRRGANRPGSGS